MYIPKHLLWRPRMSRAALGKPGVKCGSLRCRAPVAAQQRSSAPGRFELHGRGALRRAVSSREVRARSNMSSFARWNQPLMPIALHNSGQNRLQIKMAKAWAASRERSLDGCPGVAKGMSTASDAYVDFPRQSAGFWARLRLQQVLVSALVVPPRDHLWPPNPQPYTCHRP